MSKVLVIFDRDWADEFTVYGFAVYDKDEWERKLKAFVDAKEWNGYSFGSNEGWYNDDAGEKVCFAKGYTARDITDDEADVMNKLFCNYNKITEFGHFPHPDELIEGDEDDNEQE